MDLPSILRITESVSRVLTELRIPHLVGGSVASILYGQMRTTLDTDLVADLQPHHIQPLTAALSHDFYIEPERVADAIRRRASFNVIHHRTNIKVDIFVLKQDSLSQQEMARRRFVPMPETNQEVPVASPEDIILQKLLWYQMGNRISDRQWGDILGVLKIQRTGLDFNYLKEWAHHAGVKELLKEAYEDAGIDPARA